MFKDMSYNEVYRSFQFGTITEDEWRKYVRELMFQILEDNKEIFERMKEK